MALEVSELIVAVLEDLAERGLDAGPTRPALAGTRLSCVSVRCEWSPRYGEQ